jgi:hypothetical protein
MTIEEDTGMLMARSAVIEPGLRFCRTKYCEKGKRHVKPNNVPVGADESGTMGSSGGCPSEKLHLPCLVRS